MPCRPPRKSSRPPESLQKTPLCDVQEPSERSRILAVPRLNLLCSMSSNIGLRVVDVAEMGARRISVGSSLFRTAWTGFARAAELIAREGNFTGFDHTVPFADINKFFSNLC